jgi:hypothetical protein
VAANGHLEVERVRRVKHVIPLFIKLEERKRFRYPWKRFRELEGFIGRRLTFNERRLLELGESVYLGDF